MYGHILGRFFLKPHLRQEDDDTPDTCTISELVETYELWPQWIASLPHTHIQLYTMFETSDVHPDIIANMKLFHRVIVPLGYLRDILVRHGVNCVSADYYNSPLVLDKPVVLTKKVNPHRRIFLYVGTNDVRKNTKNLVKVFDEVLRGTEHKLIMKTNTRDGLPDSPNVVYRTDRVTPNQLAGLYNACDYVVSFTRGEGVGLPMLEAQYFGKPVIAHDRGVFAHIKDSKWVTLPSHEVPIDYTEVPAFLTKVFHGTWWDVDYERSKAVLLNLLMST